MEAYGLAKYSRELCHASSNDEDCTDRDATAGDLYFYCLLCTKSCILLRLILAARSSMDPVDCHIFN